MTDNLRDRIAAALDATHDGVGDSETWLTMADAVIEALKLRREETLHSLLPDYERNTVRTNVWATRYVTDWEGQAPQYCNACGRPHRAGECQRDTPVA